MLLYEIHGSYTVPNPWGSSFWCNGLGYSMIICLSHKGFYLTVNLESHEISRTIQVSINSHPYKKKEKSYMIPLKGGFNIGPIEAISLIGILNFLFVFNYDSTLCFC